MWDNHWPLRMRFPQSTHCSLLTGSVYWPPSDTYCALTLARKEYFCSARDFLNSNSVSDNRAPNVQVKILNVDYISAFFPSPTWFIPPSPPMCLLLLKGLDLLPMVLIRQYQSSRVTVSTDIASRSRSHDITEYTESVSVNMQLHYRPPEPYI